MASKFVGNTNVQHERQPEGTEQCFPTFIPSLTGALLHDALDTLRAAGIANEDGSVEPLPVEKQILIAGSLVTIDPLELASDDPTEVMAVIDEQFAFDQSVALLHRKSWRVEEHADVDPELEFMKNMARLLGKSDTEKSLEARINLEARIKEIAPDEPLEEPVDYHWILLNGYFDTDGKKGPIHTIDPLHEEAEYIGRHMIERVIRHSTDYANGGQGIFPHRIQVEPA